MKATKHVLDLFLVFVASMLVLHALSPGTVEVPMPAPPAVEEAPAPSPYA